MRPTPAELELLRSELVAGTDLGLASEIIRYFRILDDPANIPYVIPYLDRGDPDAARMAIWTLCWLGAGSRFKDYMIESVEPGRSWDNDRQQLAKGVLRAAGRHLRSHRDRDLAQLLIRWRPRPYGDPFLTSAPFGRAKSIVQDLGESAAKGMGDAVGADPEDLLYDDDLVASSVTRFIAERQDG